MTKLRSKARFERAGDLDPDPEMWAALRNGEGLSQILDDFYTRVFADARLSPFFEGVTKQWVAEKQYSFLRQLFTGEKIYFGARPRNAHHWMVISNELFDYREELFADCLRRYGMSEPLIARFRRVHERFRKQIVKDHPRPKKIRGKAIPFEGYGTIVLEIGSLCDGCATELPPGAHARYHNRTGAMYCATCVPGTQTTRPPPNPAE